MAKYQHWCEDENYAGPEEDRAPGGDMFTTVENYFNPKQAWLYVGLKLCCEIEAETWEEACAKYHEHMGWEPYVPFDKRLDK